MPKQKKINRNKKSQNKTNWIWKLFVIKGFLAFGCLIILIGINFFPTELENILESFKSFFNNNIEIFFIIGFFIILLGIFILSFWISSKIGRKSHKKNIEKSSVYKTIYTISLIILLSTTLVLSQILF